jgi:hypothetical protein
MSKKDDDKQYSDGFRDAQHGGAPNPPHSTGIGSFLHSQWQTDQNKEYFKGYNAGETSKK